MKKDEFISVWDAIEDAPEQAEAMKLRSRLMILLQESIAGLGLNRADAARRFGVTEPRIRELLEDKVNAFDLDALITMAASAGLHCDIQLRPAAEQ